MKMEKIIEVKELSCFECGSHRVRCADGEIIVGSAYTFVCTDGDDPYHNDDGTTCYHNRGGWFRG